MVEWTFASGRWITTAAFTAEKGWGVLLDGEWIPTRIELGEFWYLKGVKLIKLNGLIVRIED